MEDDDIRDFFAGLGSVSIRRLFGGKGIYFRGEIVGIDMGDHILLKGDTHSAPAYEAAGSVRWTYQGKKKPVAMPYWSVPVDVIEDGEEMARWVNMAYEAAVRSRRR